MTHDDAEDPFIKENKDEADYYLGKERRKNRTLNDPASIAELFRKGAWAGGEANLHDPEEGDLISALFAPPEESEGLDLRAIDSPLEKEKAPRAKEVTLQFATADHIVTSRVAFQPGNEGGRISFPEEVTIAPQKRGDQRVRINPGDDLNLLVDGPSGVRLEADPTDISQGGLAFSLAGGAEELTEGAEVKVVLVRLGAPDMEIRGVVVDQSGAGETQCLRVRFEEGDPSMKSALSEMVDNLSAERRNERESLFGD